MKQLNIFTIVFSLIIISLQSINAQCNETLVKQAIQESGNEAIFLKEFKVKFKKGKANRPARVAKYSAFLKDSTTYRFNVVNAKEYDGKVILQLFRKGKIYGSTYGFKTREYHTSFDYKCEKTGNYQVLMSFIEGKAGCATGIMSLVVNDSTVINDNQFPDALYVGISNPLYIAYTNEPGCSVKISASQGSITGKEGKYELLLNQKGKVIVTAQTIDSIGNVKDEIKKEFEVKKLPLPYASISGNTGGLISKINLRSLSKLDLHTNHIPLSDGYDIINFTVSDKLFSISGKTSNGENFSYSQLSFIQKLKAGDQFFITNIQVKSGNNEIVKLKPLGFIVQ